MSKIVVNGVEYSSYLEYLKVVRKYSDKELEGYVQTLKDRYPEYFDEKPLQSNLQTSK